jgi:hypothetical protein
VLERYQASAPDATFVDPASAFPLLVIDKLFDKHNGGMLSFGPLDGMLYLSTGDGGGTHDPFGSAQRLDSLLGKILRIDVDGGTPYGIPADNPFVGVPNAREEIYALGLRNPWRFGTDLLTGDLFVGDVGNNDREEIDFVPAGGGQNFGWDCTEGELCSLELGCPACPDPGYSAPIHAYDHNLGCAVLGGPIYRGSLLPSFQGRVLFADYCTGSLWSSAFDGTGTSDLTNHSSEIVPPGGFGLLTSVCADAYGELYLTSFFPGMVMRILPESPTPDCDVDGTPDSIEFAQATAFDVNENGIPDNCELLLSATHFVEGQTTEITFIGASPGDLIALVATLRGIGEGPCFYDGAWCLLLLPMPGPTPLLLLSTAFADEQGKTVQTFLVPPANEPIKISMQAVVFLEALSLVSNAIQKVLP